MNFLQIVVAVIILYLCIYALINRVCKCIEHCGCSLNDCNRFYCGIYWVVHWRTASKLRSELYVET